MENEPELFPPSPDRVAVRAVALTCVVARASIERDADEEWAGEALETAREIAFDPRFRHELEAHEVAMLQAPLGRLERQPCIGGTWRAEALAVLAWALGRVQLPRFDQLADAFVVTEALGMADGAIDEELLSAPTLRPAGEVELLTEELFAAHWRIREFGQTGEPMDFGKFAEQAWFGPLLIDRLPLVDGDLGIRGVAIGDAAADDVNEVEGILRERRTAAGWLLGEDELFSEVPLDT
jgi:Domain of unknown function (DUF4272)